MRILIFGRVGQLGSALSELLLDTHDLVFLDQPEIDLAKIDTIDHHIVKNQPDLVINAAAYTAVDKAESEPDLAQLVNALAPSQMAASCDQRHIPFIHFSTDYVFDGTKVGTYDESDLICPIGVYGKSKEAGEVVVREISEKHVILRTSWVYAAHGNNFVKTMLRIGEERQNLNVVNDQFGTPTFAGDIADAIFSIANQVLEHNTSQFWGTYHYTAKGWTTWKGFAEVIFEKASAWLPNKPHVEGIPSSQYPTAAKRPPNSVLNCSKIDLKFRPPRRHWQKGLDEVLSELNNEINS